MRKSLHEFDYMRLVMAILILLGHCVTFGNGKVFGDTTLYFNRWLGSLAVPYFFTLSGFFIRLSDDVIRTGKRMAWRLLKLYVIWSILYLPVHIYNAFKAESKLSYILGALKAFAIGNFPLWYLWGGCCGILLCIVLWKLFNANLKGLLAAGIVVYLVGSVFKYAVLLRGDFATRIGNAGAIGKFMLTDDFVRNGFVFGFPFIALGIYLAEKHQEESDLGLRVSIVGFVCSLIFGLVEVRLTYVASGFMYAATGNHLKVFLFPATYFLISMLIRISGMTQAKDTTIIRKMAGIIYFVHGEVRVFVEAVLRYLNTSSYIFNLLSGGLTAVISILVAWTMIKMSQKHKVLKKLY